MMGPAEVDVREVAPRDRHPLIFAAFDDLEPGGAFLLVNDHEPKPLYYQFQAERGGTVGWDVVEAGPERWAVRITKLEQADSARTTAALLTQPVRDEHRDLQPHIESIRVLGESAATFDDDLRTRLEAVVVFLQDHLLVHAEAEEQVLYPAVANLMGAPNSTATMSRDHVEVARLTAELVALKEDLTARAATPEDLTALRRLAFGLYALISVHFAKEEELYLPLLDAHLTQKSADDLFGAMQRVAADLHAR